MVSGPKKQPLLNSLTPAVRHMHSTLSTPTWLRLPAHWSAHALPHMLRYCMAAALAAAHLDPKASPAPALSTPAWTVSDDILGHHRCPTPYQCIHAHDAARRSAPANVRRPEGEALLSGRAGPLHAHRPSHSPHNICVTAQASVSARACALRMHFCRCCAIRTNGGSSRRG